MRFEPCALSDLKSFDHYLGSLSSPFDSFLEDHILESQFHRILIDDQEVGSFGIHGNALLTHFHLVGPARRYGQQALAEVLKQTRVKAAFVFTGDEFFLSHALDTDSDLKKQAYFFVEGNTQVALQAPAIELTYKLAQLSDAVDIRAISEDFLDKHEERIQKRQLHVGIHAGQLVAIGIIEYSRLLQKHASIGMFTHEAFRQKGVGTSTIRYMRSVCHAEGIRPMAGCWYYNHESKKTLEAAGMVTQTRLLRFEF